MKLQSVADLLVNVFREDFFTAFCANRDLKCGNRKRIEVTTLANLSRIFDGRDDDGVSAAVPASPRKGTIGIEWTFLPQSLVRENGHLPPVSKIRPG